MLLRRWATDGLIGSYNLVHDSVETPKGPKAFGYIYDFVAVEPVALEALWSEVETKAPQIFRQIDAGSLPDHLARSSLIDLFAIHLARSAATKLIWAAVLADQLAQGGRLADLISWSQQPLVLRAWFEHETGLKPAGADAEEWAQERLAERFAITFGSDGSGFREEVLKQFGRAREYFGNLALQIGHAAHRELAICDAPVATFDRETGKAGLHSGVALAAATSICLPLGPHHVLDFSSKGPDTFIELDDFLVQHLNARQVVCAAERVHFRPGSDVLKELRQARSFFAS